VRRPRGVFVVVAGCAAILVLALWLVRVIEDAPMWREPPSASIAVVQPPRPSDHDASVRAERSPAPPSSSPPRAGSRSPGAPPPPPREPPASLADEAHVEATPDTGFIDAEDQASPTEEAPRTYASDSDGFSAAVRANRHAVIDCWEGWLRSDPQIAGEILVAFTLANGADGVSHVVDLSVVDGGLGNAFMEGCVLNAMAGLQFEPVDGPLRREFGFTFVLAPDASF
jgi:hypothetical protein